MRWPNSGGGSRSESRRTNGSNSARGHRRQGDPHRRRAGSQYTRVFQVWRAGYSFTGTSQISIGPPALTPRGQLWFFAVGNSSAQTLKFDLKAEIIFTNANDYLSSPPEVGRFQVLSNLNDSLETNGPQASRGDFGDWSARRNNIESARYDQLLQTWRYRHLVLVYRIIGAGTPSLKGKHSDLLAHGMKQRFFPKLWEVRAKFFGHR